MELSIDISVSTFDEIFGEIKVMKKILVYKWYSYNDLDIEYAFLQAGYEITYVERTNLTYEKDEAFEDMIKKELETNSYSFFFTMNYFSAISNICNAYGVKYVSWTCDNPLIAMYDESVFHACNYIFAFDKSNYLEFKDRGVKHIYHLPLAVNTSRLSELLHDEKYAMKHKQFANDIAFVGSLYQKRSTYDKLKDSFPEFLNGYLDGMVQARLLISTNDILDEMMTPEILSMIEEQYHLEKTKDSFSDLGLIFQTTVLGFKIAQRQRTSALLAIAKLFSLTVYHKEKDKELLLAKEPGPVNYWLEMPFVFYNTKINLNFTIPNIKTGVPLRVFDVLGSKGFLITNAQPEILEIFEDGIDLVCFYNQEDLLHKIDYYLTHSKECEEIAAHGYETVRRKHSYQKRVRQIEEILSKDE